MKVVLTAFKGKLKSDPIDWPDGSIPEVYMLMDLERIKAHKTPLESAIFETRKTRGRFEASGQYFVLGDGETAEEYRLTDVS